MLLNAPLDRRVLRVRVPTEILGWAYELDWALLERSSKVALRLPPTTYSFQMRTAASEQLLPDERLAKQQLYVFLSPAFRGQRLQEHHHFLEIHLNQLIRPLYQESGTHVEVEVGEAAVFGLRGEEEELAHPTCGFRRGNPRQLTRYVSHMRVMFLTLISRMSRQLIHRNEN